MCRKSERYRQFWPQATADAFRADGSGQMMVPAKEVMRVGPNRANCIFAMPGCLENFGAGPVILHQPNLPCLGQILL